MFLTRKSVTSLLWTSKVRYFIEYEKGTSDRGEYKRGYYKLKVV